MRVNGSTSLESATSACPVWAGPRRVVECGRAVGGDRLSDDGVAFPAEAGIPAEKFDGDVMPAGAAPAPAAEGGEAVGSSIGATGLGGGATGRLTGGSSGPRRFSTPLKICLQAPHRTSPALNFNWSCATRNVVAQWGQRVASAMVSRRLPYRSSCVARPARPNPRVQPRLTG